MPVASPILFAPKAPPRWPRAKLGELCDLVNGDAYRDTDWSTKGVPIIRIQNLNNHEKPFNYWAGTLDDRVIVTDGDVLLAWSGTPGTSFGTHRWHRGRAVLNQHIFRVDLDGSRLDPDWAVLAINEQLEEMIGRAHGAVGLRHVTRREVESLQILLPPLPEQRRIAARVREQLSAVAEARAAVQAQFDAARKLSAVHLRAVFNSQTASRWPKRRIADVAKLQSGYAFKSEWFSGDGIRLLRNANVSQDQIDWTETVRLPATRRAEFPAYELSEGDIILSLDRPVVSGGLKVARVTTADLPALLLQRVGRFQLREGINANYLYHFLHTQDFIGEITAHDQSLGVPHVSPKQVEQVQLPVPPMAEQCTIAARIEAELGDASALAAHLSARLTALDRLPAALLREAFAGKL